MGGNNSVQAATRPAHLFLLPQPPPPGLPCSDITIGEQSPSIRSPLHSKTSVFHARGDDSEGWLAARPQNRLTLACFVYNGLTHRTSFEADGLVRKNIYFFSNSKLYTQSIIIVFHATCLDFYVGARDSKSAPHACTGNILTKSPCTLNSEIIFFLVPGFGSKQPWMSARAYSPTKYNSYFIRFCN